MSVVGIIFWLCFGAIWIYYPLGRRALEKAKLEDPQWYEDSEAKGGIGARNSVAIVDLMFDSAMPKASHSPDLKRLIWVARMFMVVGAGLLPALLVAIVVTAL
jgi:hypothetical protein